MNKKEHDRQYYLKNKERILAQQKEYHSKPENKILARLRQRKRYAEVKTNGQWI